MSEWTHRICADCYIDREVKRAIEENDGFRAPTRIVTQVTPRKERCCFCLCTIENLGRHGGIYIREDPEETLCGGIHDQNENDRSGEREGNPA